MDKDGNAIYDSQSEFANLISSYRRLRLSRSKLRQHGETEQRAKRTGIKHFCKRPSDEMIVEGISSRRRSRDREHVNGRRMPARTKARALDSDIYLA